MSKYSRLERLTPPAVPYEFFVSGIKFKITDVGGDRGQRSNWIDVMGVRRGSGGRHYYRVVFSEQSDLRHLPGGDRRV